MRFALYALPLLTAMPLAADEALKQPLVLRTTPIHAYEHGLPDAAPKGARVVSFRAIDRNRNMCWEIEEVYAVFAPRAARDVMLSFDANGDGRITRLEFDAFDDGGTGGPDGVLFERVRG